MNMYINRQAAVTVENIYCILLSLKLVHYADTSNVNSVYVLILDLYNTNEAFYHGPWVLVAL